MQKRALVAMLPIEAGHRCGTVARDCSNVLHFHADSCHEEHIRDRIREVLVSCYVDIREDKSPTRKCRGFKRALEDSNMSHLAEEGYF